jgi:hypothetical protein
MAGLRRPSCRPLLLSRHAPGSGRAWCAQGCCAQVAGAVGWSGCNVGAAAVLPPPEGPRASTAGTADAKTRVAITHLRHQRHQAPGAGLRPRAARRQSQHAADSALRPHRGLALGHCGLVERRGRGEGPGCAGSGRIAGMNAAVSRLRAVDARGNRNGGRATRARVSAWPLWGPGGRALWGKQCACWPPGRLTHEGQGGGEGPAMHLAGHEGCPGHQARRAAGSTGGGCCCCRCWCSGEAQQQELARQRRANRW